MSKPFESEVPARWLCYCADLLGGPKLTQELVEVYFRAVGSDDAEAVTRALGDWLRAERRFPAPADIRQALGMVQE
ncbi:hypothetical protein [Corticimicrobacter populi]|nr:hypothetical protein [Corticimicrobacter populi]